MLEILKRLSGPAQKATLNSPHTETAERGHEDTPTTHRHHLSSRHVYAESSVTTKAEGQQCFPLHLQCSHLCPIKFITVVSL